MNIYDFDKTIFDGDSENKLFWYSIIRHPLIVLLSVFKALIECIKYLFHKSNLGFIKSALFSYVKYIKDLDLYMDKFSNKYMKNIKDFYKEKQKDNDVIISASFEFVVKPFCNQLGINNLIATKFDTKKGSIIGNNCKGKEKIIRFRKIYPSVIVNEAYSDSLSDIPMFEIAKKAYLVKGNLLEDFKN